jgi:hypothetical protein
MALTLDQLTAITKKYYVPKASDAIFQSNAFLDELNSKAKMSFSGGTSIVHPLAYAQTSASDWFAGSDTLSTTDNEQLTGADFSLKQIYANIAIKRSDELKNAGDAAVIDLLKQKTMLAQKTMSDKIATGLFNTGSASNAITGLRHIVEDSNTVGGIDQSSYSWWQAGSFDESTTTLSLALMQTMYNNLTIGNDKPDLLVSGRTVFNIYYSLLQPQQRFVNSTKADAGFQNLLFNGTTYIVDSHCPALYLYCLNLNYLHLVVHSQEWMRLTAFQEPINQNVKVAKLYSMLAFTCDNVRMQGACTAIAA